MTLADAHAELVESLDERVRSLAGVSWEVGPGVDGRNALVITPDGRKERLEACRRIVNFAPSIEGWEFHSAKPPKRWELQFSIEGSAGSMLQIDARDWRYVLYQHPDGTFDVVIEQTGLHGVDDAVRHSAAVIVLDGVLGELQRLERMRDIEAVPRLEDDQASSASSVRHLADHLRSLK